MLGLINQTKSSQICVSMRIASSFLKCSLLCDKQTVKTSEGSMKCRFFSVTLIHLCIRLHTVCIGFASILKFRTWFGLCWWSYFRMKKGINESMESLELGLCPAMSFVPKLASIWL